VSADLKLRLSKGRPSIHICPNWTRRAFLDAVCLVGLAVLLGSWRRPIAPAVTFGEYADEMVSFVRLDPPLAFKSAEDASIERFLSEADAPSHLDLVRSTGTFSSRMSGPEVPRLRRFPCLLPASEWQTYAISSSWTLMPCLIWPRDGRPHILESDGWSTAAWVSGDQAYMLAGQGSKQMLQPYVRDS
jgi:hypothetical protein